MIELRGDGFLEGQVCRIVGAAVAIANGWLPSSFFEYATRGTAGGVVAPCAPKERLVFDGARYDFHELNQAKRGRGGSGKSRTEGAGGATALFGGPEVAVAVGLWRRDLYDSIAREVGSKRSTVSLAPCLSFVSPRNFT